VRGYIGMRATYDTWNANPFDYIDCQWITNANCGAYGQQYSHFWPNDDEPWGSDGIYWERQYDEMMFQANSGYYYSTGPAWLGGNNEYDMWTVRYYYYTTFDDHASTVTGETWTLFYLYDNTDYPFAIETWVIPSWDICSAQEGPPHTYSGS
jgi:hypothetical protein